MVLGWFLAAAATCVPLATAAPCVPRYGPGRHLINVTVDDDVRPLLLNVPTDRKDTTALGNGAVVGLHGWHSNPWYYDRLANLSALGAAYGVVAALPFGTSGTRPSYYCCPVPPEECADGTYLDSARPCGWNNGDDDLHGVDDVAYVKTVAALLVKELCVDERKLFATGLSDGGAMTARLACDAADVLAGVATMSGTLKLADCAPAKPLAYLEFCGTLDAACNVSSYGTYDTWAGLNACATRFHATYESATTACRVTSSCRGPSSFVEQCMVLGLGDAIPGHDRFEPLYPGEPLQDPTNVDSVKYALDRWSTIFSGDWQHSPAFSSFFPEEDAASSSSL